MVNKGDFYMGLTEEQQTDGWIKFNIPAPEGGMKGLNGEGVWGWVSPEDKEKWKDDGFFGKIKAILLNDPLHFAGQLPWGTEVVIQCHGQDRPTLDVEWAKENLIFPKPGITKTYRIFFNDGDQTEIGAESLYDAIREAMVIAYEDGQDFHLDNWEVAE